MSKQALSLEAFRDWAKTKDPDEEYDYLNACNCAGAQYAESLGLFNEWRASYDYPGSFWKDVDDAAYAPPGGRTFGNLVKELDRRIAQ